MEAGTLGPGVVSAMDQGRSFVVGRHVPEEDEEKNRKPQYTQDQKALYKPVQHKAESSPYRQGQDSTDDGRDQADPFAGPHFSHYAFAFLSEAF